MVGCRLAADLGYLIVSVEGNDFNVGSPFICLYGHFYSDMQIVDAEKYSPKNELEPEEKPAGFGHFFSRIGPARNRSKSHRESFKKDAVARCSTQLVYSIKNVIFFYEDSYYSVHNSR